MKVKDTFAYCSAKVPMLVTEGVGKVLFDGDRNEMPESIKNREAWSFSFLFHERKFWCSVHELPENSFDFDKEQLSDEASLLLQCARQKAELDFKLWEAIRKTIPNAGGDKQ